VATSGGDSTSHSPRPSLWPVGFAIGIACILVGLIVSWYVVAAGAVIAIVFGLLWARDATREYREPVHVEPETTTDGATATSTAQAEPRPANEGEAAMPVMQEGERYPRSRFLEVSTLGLGAAIGALVTIPIAGFAVVPSFVGQKQKKVDLGPLRNFPENEFVIATFMLDPKQGEVSRRTAYIRNNGLLNGEPSLTIMSNRCVHLGCPAQPNGLIQDRLAKDVRTPGGTTVHLIPVQSLVGFGCPCHGGQYNTEGNRTAGPPVRSLDRYEYAIDHGRVILLSTYSVGKVVGVGKDAMIKKYPVTGPGEHVDGPEAWLYPIQPSQISS
jgi:Rieske Fe-S protein